TVHKNTTDMAGSSALTVKVVWRSTASASAPRGIKQNAATDHTPPIIKPAPMAARSGTSSCAYTGATENVANKQKLPATSMAACHGPSVARKASKRSEEHTSELQSRENLVCRLLLE